VPPFFLSEGYACSVFLQDVLFFVVFIFRELHPVFPDDDFLA
jgi:hypothetical protein